MYLGSKVSCRSAGSGAAITLPAILPRWALRYLVRLGINIGALGETESVVFYNKLIKSRDLLREVALHEYRFPASRQAALAVERPGIDAREPGECLDRREPLAACRKRAQHGVAVLDHELQVQHDRAG